ncbi:MAG TPA: hypothetical protein VKU35_02435 [Candidatus Limnocylindria bacterium]|nr:hypothetical protein [Candidatus Limnocylindria bacterium]
MSGERRLDELTNRWRTRHETRRARRDEAGTPREPADAERLERACRAFPYRETTPSAYVAAHGDGMTAYTYDDYAYPDVELQAWLDEVGRLLRRAASRR